MKSLRPLAVLALFIAPACTTFGTASEGDDAGTSPTSTSTSDAMPPGPSIVLPDGAILVPDAAQPPGTKDASSDARAIDAASSRPCIMQPSFRCIDFAGADLEVFEDRALLPPSSPIITGSPSATIGGGSLVLNANNDSRIHAWFVELPTPTPPPYAIRIGVQAVTGEVEVFRVKGANESVIVTATGISVNGASAPTTVLAFSPPYELVVTPGRVTVKGSEISLAANYFAGTGVQVGGARLGRGAGPWSLTLGYIRVTK